MLTIKSKILEEIKNDYKYEINCSYSADYIYDILFAIFIVNFEKYNFNERITELNKNIKKNIIDKESLDLYANKLKEIKETIEKTFEKLTEDFRSKPTILFHYMLHF